MSISGVSSSRGTTKRPREENVPLPETTKKTKQVAKGCLKLLDTYTTINIFRNLDGVSLTRMAATAHRYRSMIRSDKCLSKKFSFETVFSLALKVARTIIWGDNFFANLACILIKTNHPKSSDYIREVKPDPIYQLKIFKALALKKHPKSHEFLPTQEDFKYNLRDYAKALAESKHPKALDVLESLLRVRANSFDMETLIEIGEELIDTLDQLAVPGSWHLSFYEREMDIYGDLSSKCAKILHRIVDLGEHRFRYHIHWGNIREFKFLAEWINLMQWINHPRTEEFFTIITNGVAGVVESMYPYNEEDIYTCRLTTYQALGSYCIKSGHPNMLAFLNRAINARWEKAYKFRLLLAFAKEFSKTNHPKTFEFIDRASQIALEQRNKGSGSLWSLQFSQLALVMVSVHHPRWHEFFLRSLQLDSSSLLVHENLCKIWKVLKLVSDPKADEVYQDLMGYTKRMPGGYQRDASLHIAINMAAVHPLKAYEILERRVGHLLVDLTVTQAPSGLSETCEALTMVLSELAGQIASERSVY